jgi:branched-chain amino acid transport system substrate-binding protein
MKVKMKSIFTIICVCAMMFGPQLATAKEQIKIGVLFPFTGDLARLGNDSFDGAELARVVQNEKGGLFGKEIVFVRADAPDPKAAVTETERLITKDNVQLIIGSYSSSLSMVASEVAEKHGVIYWEQGAIADKITERGFKNLFRVTPKVSKYAEWSVQCIKDVYCAKIGIKPENIRIAAVYEDSLMGTTQSELIKKHLDQIGLKLVASEFYNRKAVDLSPMIMRLKQAKPDILLGSQYLNDAILFWRQSKELDLNVKVYSGVGGGISMNEFYEGLGKDAELVMEAAFGAAPDTINPQFAPPVKDFLAKHKQVFGREATSVYPSVNYTGSMALWEVLKKAGSLDPQAVRKAALEIDIPDNTTTAGWGVKFDEAGQNVRAKIITTQWQEGKLWVVLPEKAALPGKELKLPLKPWKER